MPRKKVDIIRARDKKISKVKLHDLAKHAVDAAKRKIQKARAKKDNWEYHRHDCMCRLCAPLVYTSYMVNK